jgi:hypothetical protein
MGRQSIVYIGGNASIPLRTPSTVDDKKLVSLFYIPMAQRGLENVGFITCRNFIASEPN